ncbi:hypothetical protein BP5796_00038 [Coleophoma crateriformis]|uniref:Six-bladed beta-propeller-like protein n=1 Tax=Coleophoma crateriformis TaxID=565419 RepID=A0A3D8T6V0_9HELO|nr:hypothetical protein BP5796_00038 [Coleophoma crateriformis]
MRPSTGIWGLQAILIGGALVNCLATNTSLVVNSIYQGATGTWYENLAVRANGQILVSRRDSPILELIDPAGGLRNPIAVNTFSSDYAGLAGISETTPDVFYIIAAGNYSVFKVDMNTFTYDSSLGVVTSNATVSKVTAMPEAGLLNGMASANASEGIVLLADSLNGWIWRLHVNTGSYAVDFSDATTDYLNTSTTKLGVNGLKVRDSYLYYSNTGNPVFSRVPINSLGSATGPAEVVANISAGDDFVFASNGVAILCQNSLSTLSTIVGSETTLIANSTILAGVTAGAFGRTSTDAEILYLTTKGSTVTSSPLLLGGCTRTNCLVVTGVAGGYIAYVDTRSLNLTE